MALSDGRSTESLHCSHNPPQVHDCLITRLASTEQSSRCFFGTMRTWCDARGGVHVCMVVCR